MEIVDKVDINDKIIGETTKEEAHEKGFFHRIAAIFVFRGDGKLLVQLRANEKNGMLDHTVGGHVGIGESYYHAAMREMKEEIGAEFPLTPLGTFYEEVYRVHPIIRHYFYLYETRINDEQEAQIKTDPREVEKLIPMELKEVISLMQNEPGRVTVGFMTALNFYIKLKKLPLPAIDIPTH